jgi:hypothetical protein
MRRSHFVLLVLVLLVAQPLLAKTYYVGSCKTGAYGTIGAAVAAVPAGSTINICPGTYSEQVVISQPLTLKGVAGSGAAVVTVPAGGLTQYDDTWATVYYQILVQTTGPVNITDLAVDGTGGSVPDTADFAGIYYLNSSGTVSEASVHNQIGTSPGYGIGILAITTQATPAQTMSVQSSVVRDSGFGIFAQQASNTYYQPGVLTLNVKSSTIRIEGGPGVWIQGDVSGLIQTNMISDTNPGLDLFDSSVTATENTISAGVANSFSTAYYLISINGGSNTIKSNKLDAAGGLYGIYLAGPTDGSLIQSNTVASTQTAITGCTAALGYTVTNNTIIDANVGLSIPSGNTSTPNSFYDVGSVTAPCSGSE